jgi:hypothetical protein
VEIAAVQYGWWGLIIKGHALASELACLSGVEVRDWKRSRRMSIIAWIIVGLVAGGLPNGLLEGTMASP